MDPGAPIMPEYGRNLVAGEQTDFVAVRIFDGQEEAETARSEGVSFLSRRVIACSATIRQVTAEAMPSHGKPVRMKTILLVDDDQPLRALFGSILRRRG